MVLRPRGTASMEGNPLSLDEVQSVLDRGPTPDAMKVPDEGFAVMADLLYPGLLHWACAGPGFAADDGPVDAAPIQAPKGPEQRLAADEPHGGRHLPQVVDPVRDAHGQSTRAWIREGPVARPYPCPPGGEWTSSSPGRSRGAWER